VAKSPADGYTWLMAPTPFVITQYAFPNLRYDTRRDFRPVTILATAPLVFVVSASSPVKSLAELVALSKKKVGGLNFGIPGRGTLPHLAFELFKLTSGISATDIPYKGGGELVSALLSNQLDFFIASPAEISSLVAAGTIRPLAVTSGTRSATWPEVPTVMEAGYPDYGGLLAWFSIVVPAKTPDDVVARIHSAIVNALASAVVRDRITALGMNVGGETSEAFARFLESEHVRWKAAVSASGVKLE